LADQDQQSADPEVSQVNVEEGGSPSSDFSTIHFGDAELRAYERLQKVMRMIDEWLEI